MKHNRPVIPAKAGIQKIKPFAEKHLSQAVNKVDSSFNVARYRDQIEGVRISDIIARHGTPVFVFNEKAIRKRHREVSDAFSKKYPKVQFSWSYKTNYLDAICAIYHQEGSIAEVVSEFEYQKARSLGVPGNKIIFNGPYKPENALKTAFEEGAIVNLDNFDEISKAENVARSIDKRTSIGIRLNMDTGMNQQWSRFGFDLDNDTAFEAVAKISKSEWLDLNGLHAHIGTFVVQSNAYCIEVRKMIEFMRLVSKDFDAKIEFLDFGGGFPSRNRPKDTRLNTDAGVPPIREFIEAITSTLRSELHPSEYPTVYMETGRALIDDAAYMISTVDAVKSLTDGTKGYVIDAGINLLHTSKWYDYKVEFDRPDHGLYEKSNVYGPLCMNTDIVLEDVSLPPLAPGTRLILSPVGAYNLTLWMQFIRYRPAVAMIMEDGTTEEIRRAEILDDITRPERLPDKLKAINLHTSQKLK